MRCPYCAGENTQVKDSRPTEENAAIRRRRVCPDCGGRFTTFERVQLRELIVVKRSGRILTATSANRTGQPPARTAQEVDAHFANEDLLLLDGGPTEGDRPSTVVDFTNVESPTLVREGAIPWSEITRQLKENEDG